MKAPKLLKKHKTATKTNKMQLYYYKKLQNHKSKDTDILIKESLGKYISEHSLPLYKGEILRTALGKPYINYPLHIGVTHTDNTVIIGIDKENFGIDCEDLSRKVKMRDKIAEKFFNNKELNIIKNSQDKDYTFLDIWVKKEAYAKYTGMGLSCLSECDTTKNTYFEKKENDKNLLIYIYKGKNNE